MVIVPGAVQHVHMISKSLNIRSQLQMLVRLTNDKAEMEVKSDCKALSLVEVPHAKCGWNRGPPLEKLSAAQNQSLPLAPGSLQVVSSISLCSGNDASIPRNGTQYWDTCLAMSQIACLGVSWQN